MTENSRKAGVSLTFLAISGRATLFCVVVDSLEFRKSSPAFRVIFFFFSSRAKFELHFPVVGNRVFFFGQKWFPVLRDGSKVRPLFFSWLQKG